MSIFLARYTTTRSEVWIVNDPLATDRLDRPSSIRRSMHGSQKIHLASRARLCSAAGSSKIHLTPWIVDYQLARTFRACDLGRMPNPQQELLDAPTLAPLLGVDPKTIWNWKRRGKITPFPTLCGRAKYDPRVVAVDYQKAGLPLPPRLAAYLAERYPAAPSSPAAQSADVQGAV